MARWQQIDDPLLDVVITHIKARRDYATFVDPADQLDYNFARSVVIYDRKLADVPFSAHARSLLEREFIKSKRKTALETNVSEVPPCSTQMIARAGGGDQFANVGRRRIFASIKIEIDPREGVPPHTTTECKLALRCCFEPEGRTSAAALLQDHQFSNSPAKRCRWFAYRAFA